MQAVYTASLHIHMVGSAAGVVASPPWIAMTFGLPHPTGAVRTLGTAYQSTWAATDQRRGRHYRKRGQPHTVHPNGHRTRGNGGVMYIPTTPLARGSLLGVPSLAATMRRSLGAMTTHSASVGRDIGTTHMIARETPLFLTVARHEVEGVQAGEGQGPAIAGTKRQVAPIWTTLIPEVAPGNGWMGTAKGSVLAHRMGSSGKTERGTHRSSAYVQGMRAV